MDFCYVHTVRTNKLLPKFTGRDGYSRWVAWGAMTWNSEEEHTVYLLLTRRVTKNKSRLRWQQHSRDEQGDGETGTEATRHTTGAGRRSRGAALTTDDGDTIRLLLSTYLRLTPAQQVVHTAPPPFGPGNLPCTQRLKSNSYFCEYTPFQLE